MRKEITFALVAGIILGLIAAFGFWHAKPVVKEKVETAVQKALTSPTPSTIDVSLEITNPKEKDVFTDAKVKVAGIISSANWIVISDENYDYVVIPDIQGHFEQEIELVGGVNYIFVTALNNNGSFSAKDITIIHSSEFGKELSSENGPETKI